MGKFYRFMTSALVIALIFILAACGGSRAAITADQFISEMQNAGYEIVDATDQFSEGAVEQVVLAGNENLKIEFYVLPSAAQAQAAFNENKADFESEKGSSSSNESVAVNNYGYYTQSSNGQLYVVAYIDNTMIYSVVSDSYKTEVNDLITSLGYLGKTVSR